MVNFKTLSEDEYPYSIQNWEDEKKYSSPHDYFERPEKYISKFFQKNKVYQGSLEKYFNRKYLGDTFTPYFSFDPYLATKPLYRILEGDSCEICHNINVFWGWEFLRRNHAYQYAFDRYMNKESFINEGFKLEYKNIEGVIDGRCAILNEAHIINEDGTARPLIDHIAGFFGIKAIGWELPDPRNNHPHHSHFWILNPGVSISTFDSKAECQRALYPQMSDEIVFKVNVRLPLPAQIQHIKETMKSHAKKMKHKNTQDPNNTEFKKIIRVLDAERSKIPKEIIASEIYPNSNNTKGHEYSGTKAVRKALNRGLELSRKEYLRFFYKGKD